MADKDAPCIDYFSMGPWPIYVGFTMSAKAFRKEMRRLEINPAPPMVSNSHSNATTHFLTAPDNGLTAIIAMPKPKGRSPEQIAGLLAHEAVHVAQELWENIGERRPGAEAEAYFVQMITQCCLQIALDTGRTRKEAP